MTKATNLNVISGTMLMDRHFGDGRIVVLVHTYAEWQARLAGRQYLPWPRFSMPREPRPLLPLLHLMKGFGK